MSVREGFKNVYLKHLGLLLAGTLTVCSLAVIGTSYCLSANKSSFWGDLLLNLGPEIFGMAATIGFVDYLLKRRERYEHVRSVNPMARELLVAFHSLHTAYDNYLTSTSIPSPDAIERYRAALGQTELTANRIITLVDEQQPEIATKLAIYIVNTGTHLVALGNAIAAVRSAAPDRAARVELVRTDAEELLKLSDDIRTQVMDTYKLSVDLPQEKN